MTGAHGEGTPDLRLAGEVTLRQPSISSLWYEQVPGPGYVHLNGREIMNLDIKPPAAL